MTWETSAAKSRGERANEATAKVLGAADGAVEAALRFPPTGLQRRGEEANTIALRWCFYPFKAGLSCVCYPSVTEEHQHIRLWLHPEPSCLFKHWLPGIKSHTVIIPFRNTHTHTSAEDQGRKRWLLGLQASVFWWSFRDDRASDKRA